MLGYALDIADANDADLWLVASLCNGRKFATTLVCCSSGGATMVTSCGRDRGLGLASCVAMHAESATAWLAAVPHCWISVAMLLAGCLQVMACFGSRHWHGRGWDPMAMRAVPGLPSLASVGVKCDVVMSAGGTAAAPSCRVHDYEGCWLAAPVSNPACVRKALAGRWSCQCLEMRWLSMATTRGMGEVAMSVGGTAAACAPSCQAHGPRVAG